jgi:RHS repeat-associated protein
VQTNETRCVYDGMLAVQERDENNAVRVTYTRGLDLSGTRQGAGGIGGLLARTDAFGSHYFHADSSGNVTALMDAQENIAARYLYNPFGKLVAQWGPMAEANRHRFSSKEQDASGLYYYGFRFYEPNLHRWMNEDPLGEAGGINLHAFVENNPVTRVDPNGLLFKEFFNELGQKLYNLMMGDEPGRYNQDTQGAQRAALLEGIDRENNALSQSISEAVGLAGDQATDALAGAAAGKLLGAAAGAVCKKIPKPISTGRAIPSNLKEKLAMEQVMAKPKGTTPPRMPP